MNKQNSEILWSHIFLSSTKTCLEKELIKGKWEKHAFSSKYDNRNSDFLSSRLNITQVIHLEWSQNINWMCIRWMFGRGHLLNVLCTFSLCPVLSGWQDCFSEKFLSGRKDSKTFKNWQHQKINFVFESTQPFVS